jgi:hypothetical protein
MAPCVEFPIAWVFGTIVPTILRLDGLRVVMLCDEWRMIHEIDQR